MIESIIGFSVLIALILLRLPLAFAMGVIGFVGITDVTILDKDGNALEAQAA